MPRPLIAALTASDWIAAGSIAFGSILLSVIMRRLVRRYIRRGGDHAELVDVATRLLVVVILTLGAFYSLRAVDVEVGPVLGALGIGALFIAVGLQPLLVNFVGSVILQTRRPFRRGDQIFTNGFEGTVIEITATQTMLLSYNGEAIHVPNGDVLGNPIVNWTHERIRRSVMPITLPYGCELAKVLAAIGRAVRKSQDDENLPPAEALAMGFGAHGIEIVLRFWHYSDELETRVATSQVAVAVDDCLRDLGVAIPYNQMVLHPNSVNQIGIDRSAGADAAGAGPAADGASAATADPAS
jgi:small-conductance mechanosensitive channel